MMFDIFLNMQLLDSFPIMMGVCCPWIWFRYVTHVLYIEPGGKEKCGNVSLAVVFEVDPT